MLAPMSKEVPDTPAREPRSPGEHHHSAAFLTTRWSLVLAAGNPTSGDSTTESNSRHALGQLYQAYWYPLYAHIRRQGHGPETAMDLVHDLFARFLEKGHLAGVSPDRGRFRSYLLACVNHLLAGQWQRNHRQKRGGGIPHVALDALEAEERYRLEPSDARSPESLFDRRWALTLLERVLLELRTEWDQAGKVSVFDALRPLVLGEAPEGYASASASLGMSEGAARVSVHRLRQQFRDRLRSEILQTLADPTTLDNELRHLLAALRNPAAT
jgi:RNA polymerase sigma-70 factor (ECF subfamily)